jgi:hypothetical protein
LIATRVIAGAATVLVSGALVLAPFRVNAAADPWVASATIALALATGWLGWQTRQVSRETSRLAQTTTEEMALLRKQTEALTLQSETTRQQLEHERDRFARQARTHVIWDDLASPEYSVVEEPPWHGAREGDLALRIVLKAKNVSPVAARIDRVVYSERIGAAVVNERIVAPAETIDVVLYIGAKVGENLRALGEDLVLHYRSTVSDEPGLEKAALFIDGKVTNVPPEFISGEIHWFTGSCYAIPMSDSSQA